MPGDPYTIAGRFTLWYAFLGGPIAWTLHLLASYAPVEVACGSVGPALLVGITAATALLSLGAGVAGWRAWRRARAVARAEPSAEPSAEPREPTGRGAGATAEGVAQSVRSHANGAMTRRTRFMGLCGMIMGGFFAFAILVEGLPVLVGDPCLSLP